MKTHTKLLTLLVVVVLMVGVVFRITGSDGDTEGRGPGATLVPTPTPEPLKISVIAALPVEPWASAAAATYNAEDHFISGQKVTVEVLPQEGLPALEKWASGSFDPIPTAWLAESRAWVDQANVAALDRTGQDIFLAGGQYRAQPIVLSPLVWAIWEDVFNRLVAESGTEEISWDELHDAGVKGDLGLVIGDPKRDPAGITALANAAAEFLDKPTVRTRDLDPAFFSWLAELLDAAAFSHFGIEDMLLFGPPEGDAGLGVENFLLSHLRGLEQRWGQRMTIVYPDPIAWFDFPYAIYMGKETSAEEKQGALNFKDYLLSADQQSEALEFGLRPACVECPSAGGLISELKNQGVLATIPSTRMRPPSRKVLEALNQWYAGYEE